MKTKTTFSRSMAIPAKHLVQRFALFLLVVSAAGLMVLGKFDVAAVDRTRVVIADSVAPVLEAMSRPVEAVSTAAEKVRGIIQLYHENARLERENTRLRHWEQVARRLAAENAALRGQLGVVAEPGPRYVSARVIGDSSGPFVRTLLVNAGRDDGVVKGAAAITSAGWSAASFRWESAAAACCWSPTSTLVCRSRSRAAARGPSWRVTTPRGRD